MKKLFLLLILSFFSLHSFAGSCPDGSDPVKSISADGTYFVYNCGGGNEKASSSTAKSLKFELDTTNGKLEDYSYITDPTGKFNKVHKFTTGSECGSKTRDIDWDNMVGEMETSDCGENSVRSQMVEQVWEDNRPGDIQPNQQWYSWDVYLPNDFPIQDSGKLLLGEFHNSECPHIAFTSQGGEDNGVLHFTTQKLSDGDCADYGEDTSKIPITQIQDMRGKWTNFHLEMKWENNETGLANLWLNGKQVLAYKGRTLTLQKENLNFMLIGLYQCCNDRDKVIKPAMAYFTTPKTSMNPITPVEVTLDNKKTASSFKVKPELEASLSTVGEFDLKKLGENKNPNLFAFSAHSETFDINQDGHDDLIIPVTSMNSKNQNVPYEPAKPILLFWDNDIKEYVIDEEVQSALPSFQWPRRIRSSINPITGFTEIFVADTGLDLASYDMSKGMENLPPNCGAQNHLITYDPGSGKVNEIQLPKIWDYPHGLATGDLNGDQITDYVVFNSPYIKFPAKCLFKGAGYTNESYILYSNMKGGYDKTDIKLNYQGWSTTPSIQSAEIIVDENEQTYLILGSEGGKGKGDGSLFLMKQDSKGSFTETSKAQTLDLFRQIGQPVYGEILVADVDADGIEEVIAASNVIDDSVSLWVGRHVQIFDIKNGRFSERSDAINKSSTIDENKGGDWCHHLFFNEKTAWNMPFLTCTNLQPQIEERGSLYVRSDNKFQFAKMKFKSNQETEDFAWMRSFYPINIDQKTIFVGRRITGKKVINGEVGFNSIKLYLLKPPATAAKASNAFDGSYSFTLDRFNPSEGSIDLGRGILEIKDGKISVAKKSRQLKTSSTSYYDTFEGQVDKQGNITSSFTVNALKGKGSPVPVNFSGSMNEFQIKGKFDDYFEMIIQMKPIKPIKPVKKVGEAANTFDGSYAIIIRTEPNDGQKNIGTAQFIIKDGKISVARKYRYLSTSAISSYDTFEGVIDKKGNINASIEINPIMHMVEPKSIKLSGTMESLQMQGIFDNIKSWDNNTKEYVLDENFYPYNVIIDFKKENY
ncbi:heparin lyase I family protein [Pseudothioglobus sp. nBUS_23]|uniref:heparin lyase I family protein n=1 Tax=Pseudothioglobus sp. nBUS_23 TaxID=3395318 RepID=UPI003EB6E2E1